MTNRQPSDSHERQTLATYHEDMAALKARERKKGFRTEDDIRRINERRIVLQAMRELFSGLSRPDVIMEKQVARHLRVYYDSHAFLVWAEWLDPNFVRTEELWQRWRNA